MDFSLFCLHLQMMFKSIFIWGTIGVCCTLFAPSCKDQERGHAIDLPVDKFHEGDIVFRRGMGLTSQIVLAADSKGTYSHIGILKQIDNNWYVIHAVPGEPDYKGDADRVKIDDLYRFFAPDRASRGAVMRVDGESRGRSPVRPRLQFDRHDTNVLYRTGQLRLPKRGHRPLRRSVKSHQYSWSWRDIPATQRHCTKSKTTNNLLVLIIIFIHH